MVKTTSYENLEKRIREQEQVIADLKLQNKKLQNDVFLINSLFNEVTVPVFYKDKEGRYLGFNKAFEAFFGETRERLIGKFVFDINPPELAEIYHKKDCELFESGTFQQYESQVKNALGEMRNVIFKKTVFNDRQGDIAGLIGTVIDITEIRIAEQKLKEREEKYKGIFNESITAIYVFDTEKNFIDSNQAGLDLLGYTRNELLSMSIPDVDADPVVVLPAHNQLLGGDRIINYEHRLIRKDGKIITVLNNSRPLMDHENHVIGMLSTLIDITEKRKAQEILQKAHNDLEQRVQERTSELERINKKLKLEIAERKQAVEALRESEAKLVRSKKMESLGLLAGGVAHDLNNVLSGIVSYPELILLDLPEDSKLKKPIETIQESGHRAVAIVQDLLTVARGVATVKEPLNLNDIIHEYLNSPEFKSIQKFQTGVQLDIKLDRNLLNIMGSYVHIRKVLMNLMTNASEAVGGRGNIFISTENAYIDKPLKSYDDINIGEYAVLTISDNGPGILPGDLERIFEPFYTKKIMGRSGTGLGLTVVWNTVQDHNGYIDVKSDQSGTKLQLYFPITREEISKKDLPLPIRGYKGNGETILVVDDEVRQREISCKILETLGYKCEAVSSGEAAIEYLKHKLVDLVLLDMIMDPGINGHETYKRIIEFNAKQKAIIVSGFAETDEVQKTQKLGAGKYVKKPLTLQKIGIAVKEELEK